MITEHNYQKLYLLKVPTSPHFRKLFPGSDWLYIGGESGRTDREDDALTFLHPKDAKRRRDESHTFALVVEIQLPYRLEYDEAGVIWHRQRYYRTKDAALAGFRKWLIEARSSSLADHMWRVVDLITGEVVAEGQPDQIVEIA